MENQQIETIFTEIEPIQSISMMETSFEEFSEAPKLSEISLFDDFSGEVAPDEQLQLDVETVFEETTEISETAEIDYLAEIYENTEIMVEGISWLVGIVIVVLSVAICNKIINTFFG